MAARDCIHLHACRRLERIYKQAGRAYVPRQCDRECSCYQTFESKVDAMYMGVMGDIETGCIVNGLCCDDASGLERNC